MDRFEFFFSFYGLLLGLSVAAVATGLANAVGARRSVRIGRLTPLLALFVLLDIASFWIQAWRIRDHAHVTYAAIYLGLAVALAYFVSANLVFPTRQDEWADFDDHYRAHKRHVLAGVLFANLVMAGLAAYWRPEVSASLFDLSNVAFFLPLAALLIARPKWKLDLPLLLYLVGYYAVGAASGYFDSGLSPDRL
jgi:hypothetical protein